MADKEHRQTDEILAEMEQHLSAIYEEASADIEAKAQEYFDRFKAQDEEMRKKVKSGEITEAEYIEWRRKKMLYGKRYTDMQRSLAEEISHVNETAMAYINDKLPTIYALNFNALKGAVESVVKGYSFSLVDPQVVKNLATRDKTLLPYKYVNGRKDVRWNTQKVNSAVLQGVLQGESVSDIGKRLQSVTEMNRTSAIRNARTTVTSAECKGRQDSYEQAQKDGIEIEREWIATNDMRTRHAHAFLNGKTAAVDEPFETPLQIGANLFITDRIMYPGDPEAHPANVYNCRCTIAAKVKGFSKKDAPFTNDQKRDIIKEQQNNFVPAKTIEEAEAFARQFVDEDQFGALGVNYSGIDVDVANEVNRALYEFNSRYDIGKFGGIIAPAGNTKLGKLIDDATAAYMPARRSILINRKTCKTLETAGKYFSDEKAVIQDILDNPQKYDFSKMSSMTRAIISRSKTSGRATVPENVEQAIYHELGHALESKVRGSDSWGEIQKRMDIYSAKISGYSGVNTGEYIAESFASYMKGENVADPAIIELFERLKK